MKYDDLEDEKFRMDLTNSEKEYALDNKDIDGENKNFCFLVGKMKQEKLTTL